MAYQEFSTRARRISNKGTGELLLEVIAIILLALALGFAVASWLLANSIDSHALDQCSHSMESIYCNDYNPCTLDVISPVPCALGSNCSAYQCTYIELANGTCCDQADFCYYPDPAKACVFGSCRSPDPTLCKGYCVSDSDCIPITAVTPEVSVTTSCVYQSCLTQFVIEGQVVDPLLLIDLTVANSSNISSCMDAICVNQFFFGLSTCTYQWNCAPFIDPLSDKKKRFALEIDQNGSAPLTFPRFPLPRLFNHAYETANQLILDRIASFAETHSMSK